jgi:hypothetical protein
MGVPLAPTPPPGATVCDNLQWVCLPTANSGSRLSSQSQGQSHIFKHMGMVLYVAVEI